ncbi:MAG: hypothetical protein JJE04_27055 [Acidobacteriia bacterium]|nr:hypothetical protein [Terriglobia bacterium]
MKAPRDLSSGWITYEVYQKDANGQYTSPFSGALAVPGSIPTQAITKMRMVQYLGWPEAKRSLKDNYGHPLIVKKDKVIWLLKCKPSCWRLYFYVCDGKEKRIIYVHAICKKADAEDPSDATEARCVYDGIRPGGSAITLFEFPTG